MMVQGLDVSSVQGTITGPQYGEIKARGTRFLIAKCGSGNNPRDGEWVNNVTDAQMMGMDFGAYNFAFPLPTDVRFSGRDPETQARAHFAQCAGWGSKPGQLPACLDLEWPRPEAWGKDVPNVSNSSVDAKFIIEWVGIYADIYEHLQGRPLTLYADPWMLKSLGVPDEWGSRFRLWIAGYGPSVPVIHPWAGWSFWQTAGGTTARTPSGAPVDTDEADQDIYESILNS